MKLLILVFVSSWLVVGCCEQSGPETSLVATVEGCKLYRHKERGYPPAFFSSCGDVSTSRDELHGRVHEQIPVVVPSFRRKGPRSFKEDLDSLSKSAKETK